MKSLKIIALIAFLAIAARAESQLTNISTRGVVGTGDDVMIGGFIIGGTEPKTVLIRARGPVLADFNVPGVLANPFLELFDVNRTPLANNDDWEATTAQCRGSGLNCGDAAAIEATGLDPCQPILLPGHPSIPTGCFQESAILVTLDPGNYTAHVSGVGGGTGVGLVEVFDVAEIPIVFPDIRGTYFGSGTLTQTNCQNPADNGTFGFSSSATISSQTGSNFSGSATFTSVISGINFTNNISLTGTVTTTGQLSGTFTFTLLANGVFSTNGNGTFTGQVTGNTLTVNFSGQDTFGDTCTFTGSSTGSR